MWISYTSIIAPLLRRFRVYLKGVGSFEIHGRILAFLAEVCYGAPRLHLGIFPDALDL